MTPRKRKIYFLTAVTLFILAAPLLIFYSSGYRVDLKSLVLIRTGGIFINTYPKGVKIYIDDKLAKESSSGIFSQGSLISGLRQGEHAVTIKKNGYREWAKKLLVNANLVTESRNIFLAPDNVKDQLITDGVNDFAFSDSQTKLAYATKDAIYISKFPFEKLEQIALEKDEHPGKILFMGDDYLLIESLLSNKLRKYLYDAGTGEIITLKENIEEEYIKIRYLPDEKVKLAALSSQNILYNIDISSQNEPNIIAKDVSNFEIFGSMLIYTTTEPTIVYEKDLDSDKTEQLIKTPLDKNIGLGSKIMRSRDGHRALIDNKRALYLYNDETRVFEHLADNTINVSFSPDGKKLMYQNNNEIYVYYLKDIRIQPYKNRGDKELITRFSKPILNIAWFSYDNEHIVFSADKIIKLTELDGRGQRNTYDIIGAENSSRIIYNTANDYIYFLDGTALKRVTLLADN